MSEFKTSNDWKELSQDWTGYHEEPTRHKAWNLNKEFCKVPLASTDVHKKKFVKGYSPIEEAFNPKPILKSKDEKYIVDSGASLHTIGESSLSARNEDPTKDQKLTKNHNRGSTALKCVQLVEEFAFGTSS